MLTKLMVIVTVALVSVGIDLWAQGVWPTYAATFPIIGDTATTVTISILLAILVILMRITLYLKDIRNTSSAWKQYQADIEAVESAESKRKQLAAEQERRARDQRRRRRMALSNWHPLKWLAVWDGLGPQPPPIDETVESTRRDRCD